LLIATWREGKKNKELDCFLKIIKSDFDKTNVDSLKKQNPQNQRSALKNLPKAVFFERTLKD
jgi:hypothetical protein